MRCARAVTCLALAALVLPAPAQAFRNVAVGGAVPALAVETDEGQRLAVPVPGRVTVLLFWRPGQAFSEAAMTDLAGLAPALVARGVAVVAVAETGSRPAGARAGVQVATDRDRQGADAFGVIVFPSTAVIDGGGRLQAYVPSRNANYRTLVESHALKALGAINEAELTSRLVRAGEVYGRSAEAADAAYKRGTRMMAERRWEEAARELAQALALRPELTEAHLQLGYVRLELGEPADALREFETVLAGNATSPGARVGIAIARLRLGQVDQGIRLLEEAVVLNPEPVRGHYELGRAYEARGDVERAAYHYRWALLKLLQGRK